MAVVVAVVVVLCGLVLHYAGHLVLVTAALDFLMHDSVGEECRTESDTEC